jgi:glycyl-tRNA synthetase beta chain
MAEALLVELLCEELPPKALRRLGEAFAHGIEQGLRKRDLLSPESKAKGFATPRRLAVLIDGVRSASEARNAELKLMPSSVAFDASGRATPALLKKLDAAGLGAIDTSTLKRRVDGKAEMVFVDTTTAPLPLAQALQATLADTLAAMPVPKSMSYQLADGNTTVHFARPAQGLVALHGADIVPVEALGLRSGRETRGHRFQGMQQLSLANAAEYEGRLEKEGAVVADFEQRKARILEQLRAAAAESRAELGAEGEYGPLLEEVTALVEMPKVYTGTFDEEFLSVPAECLTLTMRQNQKYFPLVSGGKLTHRFLIVSNLRPDDPSEIVKGNERVVRPRLADARFFFETDRKTRLADRVPKLGSIVHHNKLGTQLERVERLRKLATRIQEQLPRGALGKAYADRSAMLAKADLVTLMVGEFPELQGTMGRYYAEADGEEPSVVRAIEQHYWPRFAGDALPTGDASIAVALADRLDALAGFFAVGIRPTGDKDPFALRRAALGVVRILMETPLTVELLPFIRSALREFRQPEEEGFEVVVSEIWGFIRERLEHLLRERGFSAAEVAAVLEVPSDEPHFDRLDLVPRRLDAVREFRQLPEAESLAAANKRIDNILKQALSRHEAIDAVDAQRLTEAAERALYDALTGACVRATPLFEGGEYAGYLKSFAVLKGPVDAFFDSVMVMAEDADTRRNRLGLLRAIRTEMNRVADISKLAA